MKFSPLILLFLSSALIFVSSEEKFKFTNYKAVRLFPTSKEQVVFINELEEKDNKVDILGSVMVGENKSIDILLSPEIFAQYTSVFEGRSIKYQVVHENIQDLIDEEAQSMEANTREGIIFKYARYVEIMNFLEETVQNNKDIASTEIIGTTEENRILKVIKLRKGNPFRSIWMDCGIHAREWVTPSTCVYIINQLITELKEGDPVTTSLFAEYDFHILPLHNPDGYEYTHTNFRLWRKNRRVNFGATCRGTDLNRNFPSYWLMGGSTLDVCSDIHAGPFPASELETQAVTKYIAARKGRWDSFLNIHSYGNWWLSPYGHTTEEVPPDYNLMMSAADAGVQAIKAYNGSVFVAGTTAKLLYVATGGSADWAYNEMGITYSYVLELRPGPDTPDYIFNFVLPENRMPLVATETFLGIKAFLNYLIKL